MYVLCPKRLVNVGCMIIVGVIAESGRIGLQRSFGVSTLPKHVLFDYARLHIQPASAIRQFARFPVPIVLGKGGS